MSDKKEHDDMSGVETTGHEWDGIKELNNPLPRWWLWCFYATILFSIGYTIAYPAWPLIKSSTGGMLNWSSRANVAAEIAQVEYGRQALAQRLNEIELSAALNDPRLTQFAIAGGQSAFKVYCSQCHGSGAAGGTIYPNLVDDDWIWGGTIDAIYTTLNHGIRFEADEQTRQAEMPAFGTDILTREQISQVAWYTLSLSGKGTNIEQAALGAPIYKENCATCHGDAGQGKRDLGAPALNDAIWLYGSTHDQLVAQIKEPRLGVMPGWQNRLPETVVRQLTVYVHSLGGGE